MRRAAILVAVTAVLAAAAIGWLAFGGDPGHPPFDTADGAVVLSGDVDYLRVKHAAALYKQGRVKAILLTGAGVGGDSATAMRDVALLNRVPADAIVVETTSTTTRENLVRAAPLVAAKGWRTVALVTSASHMRRALGAARAAMPDVEWSAAPVPVAGPADRIRRTRIQEAAKLVWYKVRGWA